MNHKTNKNILDETAAHIASERPDANETEAAARRVWALIARREANAATHQAQPSAMNVTADATVHATDRKPGEPSATRNLCAEFQSSLPQYMSGTLTPERKLLFTDHTRECVPCRRALRDARTPATRAARPATLPHTLPQYTPARGGAMFANVASWRIAAAILLACALVGWFVSQPFGDSGFGVTVEAAEGELLRVGDDSMSVLPRGATFASGDVVRTAKDARAVLRLPDGSRIEMNDRAQLSVSASRGSMTINLDRGDVILRAAEQSDAARLSVRTPGAAVAANNSILAVASGTLGARVSVIEGEAQVNAGGKQSNLRAGEQAGSSPNLRTATIADDVAWSRDAGEYRRLLGQAAALANAIDRQAVFPGVRHSVRLLDLTPRGTIFYAGLPNVGTTLAAAHDQLQTGLQQNPALAAWWQSRRTRRAGAKSGADVEFVIERLRGWGAQIGDEIVVSAEANAAGEPDRPLVLAEVKDDAEFRGFLERELGALRTQVAAKDNETTFDVRFIDDAPATTGDGAAESNTLFVLVRDRVFAASPNADAVRGVAAALNASAIEPRDGLRGRIADVYRDGTNFVLAADLAQILKRANANDAANDVAMLHRTGFDDLRYLIIESRKADESADATAQRIENRLSVSFAGERRGIAAWLAAPHAMGAIDFISSQASVAAAFVVKEPRTMLDDLLAALGAVDASTVEQIKDAQTAGGIDLREDLAAPLGGEFAFAIDGPVLPVPSWKLIVEVYDPAKLQAALRRVVEAANRRAAAANRPSIELTTVESGGRTYHTLKSALAPVEINYTFAHGYMIFAPSRALVDRALETRASGVTLRQAPRFIAALPRGTDANFSALIYQNLAGVFDSLAPLADRLGERAADKSAQGANLAARAPALAYARAYPDRIVISAPSQGAPFGLTPGALLGLPSGGAGFMREAIERSADDE